VSASFYWSKHKAAHQSIELTNFDIEFVGYQVPAYSVFAKEAENFCEEFGTLPVNAFRLRLSVSFRRDFDTKPSILPFA